jgi:hypothetical protein
LTARVVARAPISFELASGGTTHAPLIEAAVGGAAPARYVLDTGSDVHLINEDLADELGLAKEPGEEGTDHGGASVPSWDVGDVAFEISGAVLTLRGVVAIPAPAPFKTGGIRGILAPQLLHPTAWAVIDLVADEFMLLEATDDEVVAILESGSPTLRTLTLARDRDEQNVVVGASIDGFAEVAALLDTGGKATEFSAGALPGLAAATAVRLGGGVSGTDYHGGSIGAHTLMVGGHRIPIADLRLREQIHGPQGIVGMDVLRGTILACAADAARPVFWQLPQYEAASP